MRERREREERRDTEGWCRNRERAPGKAKVTTTTIYKKKNAAYTRMVGNEINKPLAQIPIVGEMYRAVTFPFLR